MGGDGELRTVQIEQGEWEVIRQVVGANGVYSEDRRLISGPLSMEIMVNSEAIYDAFLITRPMWEEKIIMLGELNEK